MNNDLYIKVQKACPDSPISVDGTYTADLPSGDPLDIKIIDQASNPITPLSSSVSGGVLTVMVDIPNCESFLIDEFGNYITDEFGDKIII